jgi:hypothetical protein
MKTSYISGNTAVNCKNKNVSDKSCREKKHFVSSNFFPKIVQFMWKNIVRPDRPKITIWRMLFAC